jgi:hypothetical protein
MRQRSEWNNAGKCLLRTRGEARKLMILDLALRRGNRKAIACFSAGDNSPCCHHLSQANHAAGVKQLTGPHGPARALPRSFACHPPRVPPGPESPCHLCCAHPARAVGVRNGIFAFSNRNAFMRSANSAASSISSREGMSRGLPQKTGPRPALAWSPVALGQMPNESRNKPQSMHFMALISL